MLLVLRLLTSCAGFDQSVPIGDVDHGDGDDGIKRTSNLAGRSRLVGGSGSGGEAGNGNGNGNGRGLRLHALHLACVETGSAVAEMCRVGERALRMEQLRQSLYVLRHTGVRRALTTWLDVARARLRPRTAA